jgi:hypothetical protein
LNQAFEELLAPALASLSPSLAERVRAHLYSQLLCLGRHTITGLLTTQGRTQQDWSADYRLYQEARVEPATLLAAAWQAVEERLGPRQPMVLALDDTLLRKRGPKAHGVKWLRDPLGPPFAVNFVRGQRVVQFSAALRTSAVQARMVPVDFQHAPLPPKPRKSAPVEEQEAWAEASRQQSINAVAAARLTELMEQTERRVYTVCDGRFANRRFLSEVPARAEVITRIRKDSQLFYPPETQPATGRPRLYGERAPTPEELRTDDAIPWETVRGYACGKVQEFRVKRLVDVRSKLKGEKAAQVVVIAPLAYRLRAGSRLLYRDPAYLLCTESGLTLRQLLQFYLWRWDIEVNFRDEKTLLGVGEAQVRHPESCQRVPATAVAAYALLLAAADRAYPPAQGAPPALFPAPRWRARPRPRLTTSELLDRLRFELFAQALRPESFSGFWSAPPPNQSGPKLPNTLASALFHIRK